MIAGPVVVDASVVVEFLIDLGQAEAASRLFAGTVDTDAELELWAPDLINVEVASAIRKLVLRRRLPPDAGGRAIGRALRLPIRVAASAPLIPDVWRLRGSLTAYDACYVALARRLRSPFVTADRRLARTLARSKDRVIALADLE